MTGSIGEERREQKIGRWVSTTSAFEPLSYNSTVLGLYVFIVRTAQQESSDEQDRKHVSRLQVREMLFEYGDATEQFRYPADKESWLLCEFLRCQEEWEAPTQEFGGEMYLS